MASETLPALRTVDSIGSGERSLRATIVMHPDLQRIGATCDLIVWNEDRPRPGISVVVGRDSPLFSDGCGLVDLHVSRAALSLRSERGGLVIATAQLGAAVRIGPAELDRLWLSDELLSKGVAVRLGHGVVIMVREVPLPAAADAVASDAFPGCSVESQTIRQWIAAAASHELPVTLLGESGVGKELIARAIHYHSERIDAPFMPVNMAAIPESLVAAELFGTRKGAFTGAETRDGLFFQASKGTLFLDEIGDTPPAVQAQLLRVLQEKIVPVVGGKPVPVDVRVLAATDAAIDANSGFSNALRHRLAGVTIQIPPLRLRPEDIGPQVIVSLEQAGTEYSIQALNEWLRDERTAAYWGRTFFDWLSRAWPGNSRELGFEALRQLLLNDGSANYAPGENVGLGSAELSDEAIETAYAAAGYSIAMTANDLGISRGALYRRLDRHPNCRIASEVSESELDAAIAEVGLDARRVGARLCVSAHGLQARLARRQPSAL